MQDIKNLIADLQNGGYSDCFDRLYGAKADKMPARYISAIGEFEKTFSHNQASIFSAPGRTEIGGNHTDHQKGCVLAAGVDLDIICIAAKNNDNIIRIQSAGYAMDTINLSVLSPVERETGRAASLIRGVAARFAELGYTIGGFDAYTTSNVLKGSGLSSSAAFEVAVCTMLSHLYNDGRVSAVEAAIISQYAENKFFGKPCGLMDQTACSVGGFVGIDFKDPANPVIEKIDFDIQSVNHSLCIVDTGGSHADLTDEYAAVPQEMNSVAKALGCSVLREVDKEMFYGEIATLRQTLGDRAVLRAMHFFDDNETAILEKEALRAGDFDRFLQLVKASGRSSQCNLQNVFATGAPREQGLSLALALTEKILGARGGYRVHGGGFAGTIQAYVPNDLLEEYKLKIETVFGAGSCHILTIRPVGGTEILKQGMID